MAFAWSTDTGANRDQAGGVGRHEVSRTASVTLSCALRVGIGTLRYTHDVTSVPLDLSRLSAASRMFADRLFGFAPDVKQHAAMETDAREAGRFQLLVTIPSPTGDADRAIVFWMEGDEPSLGFGEWHTHASLFGQPNHGSLDELLDLFRAIRADRVVLCRTDATKDNHNETLLDLREPDALEDELTSPAGSGELELLSWGGTADRRVSVR